MFVSVLDEEGEKVRLKLRTHRGESNEEVGDRRPTRTGVSLVG